MTFLSATLGKIRKLARGAFFAGCCGVVSLRGADIADGAMPSDDDGSIPRPLQNGVFDALVASSPFSRSLNLSDSLILTGVARFDKHVMATIFNTETNKSQVVSQSPNPEGWQLVEVGGDPARMETWTAKVQVPGGEIISIRYQEPPSKRGRSAYGSYGSGGNRGGSSQPLTSSQVEEAKKAAVNYREGFTSDGYSSQPPREVVEKLSRLSVGQREDINREMIGHRNRGLGMEERRRIYEDLVDRASRRR